MALSTRDGSRTLVWKQVRKMEVKGKESSNHESPTVRVDVIAMTWGFLLQLTNHELLAWLNLDSKGLSKRNNQVCKVPQPILTLYVQFIGSIHHFSAAHAMKQFFISIIRRKILIRNSEVFCFYKHFASIIQAHAKQMASKALGNFLERSQGLMLETFAGNNCLFRIWI